MNKLAKILGRIEKIAETGEAALEVKGAFIPSDRTALANMCRDIRILAAEYDCATITKPHIGMDGDPQEPFIHEPKRMEQ